MPSASSPCTRGESACDGNGACGPSRAVYTKGGLSAGSARTAATTGSTPFGTPGRGTGSSTGLS